ncbi:MAG TPA: hypothetical protein EYQ02_13765 [Microbacterium sp.]|nr:hypothetical protein [Microbacterium sp.]
MPGLADLEAVVGLAPSLDPDWIRSLARETGIVGPVRFEPGGQTIFDAIDVAVTKPGSVTVELMLRERPMVVVGRIHPLTAAIASLSAQVSSVAMPNLIAGKVIVPELLQGDATPDRIAASLAPLFADPMAALAVAKEPTAEKRVPSPAARNQIEALRRARSLLGLPGATARTAQLVEEMLGTAAS